MKKIILALLLLAIPATSFAGVDRWVIYTGPGFVTAINQDVLKTDDNSAVVYDIGILWGPFETFGIGVEFSHNSLDWSLNNAELVTVFDLAFSDSSKWQPYFKLTGGGFKVDVEGSEGSEAFWQLEPSFGIYYIANSKWGFFANTGTNFIFGSEANSWGALQTRLGFFFRMGKSWKRGQFKENIYD